VEGFKSGFGFTGVYRATLGGKTIQFEGLPIAEFASRYDLRMMDDKALSKGHTARGGFPNAKGRSFWFWQVKRALEFGEDTGYPLVVKPRKGSVARHVTTDIRDRSSLERAIRFALRYSPEFIVERFIEKAFVFRATVIDFENVFCVMQVPAHVQGDGIRSVRDLVKDKDRDRFRGMPGQKQSVLYELRHDALTDEIFRENGWTTEMIPERDQTIFLQKDPFLKLGGDIVEVTSEVHPENRDLFRDIAKWFDARLVGIDFIAGDIGKPHSDQDCAVLELNSLPCIELHHFPTVGLPTDPAFALAEMFVKYYI
jgi:cyanophycin synthetase